MDTHNLDEFESVFRKAIREQFVYEAVHLSKIMVITDMDQSGAQRLATQVKDFLKVVIDPAEADYEVVTGDQFDRWNDITSLIKAYDPDLIVSYRLLKEVHDTILTSLGAFLDALTQATKVPVLVLPTPSPDQSFQLGSLESIVVAIDRKYQHDRLVNFGACFVPTHGTMALVHVEDEDTYDYYMTVLSKIPELDTEFGKVAFREQLQTDARHYMENVAKAFAAQRPEVNVEILVKFGQLIEQYYTLIDELGVDLLVFNTKDETQLAMHSLGYSLAVEFKRVPALMI